MRPRGRSRGMPTRETTRGDQQGRHVGGPRGRLPRETTKIVRGGNEGGMQGYHVAGHEASTDVAMREARQECCEGDQERHHEAHKETATRRYTQGRPTGGHAPARPAGGGGTMKVREGTFPQPVRPAMPIFSPADTSKDKPCSTGGRSGRYRTTRSCTAM